MASSDTFIVARAKIACDIIIVMARLSKHPKNHRVYWPNALILYQMNRKTRNDKVRRS